MEGISAVEWDREIQELTEELNSNPKRPEVLEQIIAMLVGMANARG